MKICGITRLEDALLAAELGAAAVGFVFWRESPRAIAPERAAAIVGRLPPFVTPVGVFVDAPAADLNAVAAEVGLGAVQVHRSDPPGADPLDGLAGVRTRVIRAVGLAPDTDLETLAAWPADVTVLLDAADRRQHGGTGRTIDWQLAAKVAARRPTLLAGGLRPGNVGAAIATVRPWGVDVSSGVERAPGVKDPDRLRAFFHAVERWQAEAVED